MTNSNKDWSRVELRATWTQTRKINGDSVQDKVSMVIGSWRSGKFMPLTMRPTSINSYGLSKVWFRCCSVDLRVADIMSRNSSVKSWLYADKMIMCRPVKFSGLGELSVKHKALACLINAFIETAANPQFRHNLFHSHLFRYHILGETKLPNPGFLPYYSENLFSIIKWVNDETPLSVMTKSISQWTRILKLQKNWQWKISMISSYTNIFHPEQIPSSLILIGSKAGGVV